MDWQYTPYALGSLATAILSAGLTVYVLRRLGTFGAKMVALYMIGVTIWSASYVASLSSINLSVALFWSKVGYVGIVVVPVAWLGFTAEYVGLERWLSRRNLTLLFVVPLITLALVFTNEMHHFYWSETTMVSSGSFVALVVAYGVGAWVWIAYSYALLFAGTMLVLYKLIRSKGLYTKQGKILLFGVTVPWLGNAVYVADFSPIPNLDLTPYFLLITGMAVVWAIPRFRLFDIIPVAWASIVEGMDDSVIVLDHRNRVLEANPAINSISKVSETQATGMPLDLVVSNKEIARVANGSRDARGEVRVGEGTDQRDYEVTVSALRKHSRREGIRLLVARDITERKAMEEQLQYQAFHDPLTGLPNRTLFLDRLRNTLSRSEGRSSSVVAVLFLDLDNFKYVNDFLGHGAGDQLLTAVARRLEGCVRPADTVARLGGDEFAILLREVEDADEAASVAKRVVEVLKEPFDLAGYEMFTGISVGVVLGGTSPELPEDLLRKADLALYKAKNGGKARYALFDLETEQRSAQRLELENGLRRAVEREELIVHYQPVVSLRTGQTVGFEALARWEHPERGLLMPDEFIPLAEETGLIVPIGQEVLREACQRACEWQERHLSNVPLTITVNLSAIQLRHPELVGDVGAVLQETGLEPERLMFEVTESALVKDDEHRTDPLRELRKLGVRFAIDDFGTGYSSLSYLRRLTTGLLKLDSSFMEGIGSGNREEEVVISGVIRIAHGLGLGVCAEGVETHEQASRLRKLGCDMAQGYYFSKPLPFRLIEAFLTDGSRGDERLPSP